MQKSDITWMNATDNDDISHSDASVANMQFELLQRLADRVVRDAEELAARIRKEAESEAARLIEDANRQAQDIIGKAQKLAEEAAVTEQEASVMLQQAKQRALAIETKAIRGVAQARMKVKEDIERNLVEVVGKIRDELQPSLNHLVERAKTLEEEIRAATNIQDDEATSESAPPALTAEVSETVTELHSELREAIGAVGDSELEHSPQDQTGGAEAKPQAEVAAVEPAPPQENSELFEGKVEINIAPPVNIARLLGVTRYLENTLDVKVLQTSGSWNLGSMLTISLDKPLPLVNLLKDMPHVSEARVVDKQRQSSASEQGGARKISVVLGHANA